MRNKLKKIQRVRNLQVALVLISIRQLIVPSLIFGNGKNLIKPRHYKKTLISAFA